MKKVPFLYLICLFLLASCHKDQDVFIPDEVIISPFIMGSVGGVITDINGLAIPNTSVNLKAKDLTLETKTDENGIFYFRNVELNAERTYLYTDSEAYFQGSRTFVPKKDEIEFINIRLVPQIELVSFDAAEGGTFETPEGGSLFFPPNSIKDADGNVYNGPVKVATAFLSTDNPEMGYTMPGDLRALNAGGEWQALATYGMMMLELTDDAGSLLQPVAGNTITLNIPVSEGQITTAPTSLPLWSFDSENGYWIEEGTAQLMGDHYEGLLTKTSFWNLAIPYPLLKIESQIHLFDSGKPYANVATEISVVGSGVCAYAYTDSEGGLETTVPASQVLLLKIFGQCGTTIYEAEIGPYQTDTQLGPIIVEPSNNNLVKLSGQLVDCNGGIVTRGYIRILSGDTAYVFFADDNGAFVASFDACDDTEFSLTGIDITEAKESEVATFQITDIIEVGSVSVCN